MKWYIVVLVEVMGLATYPQLGKAWSFLGGPVGSNARRILLATQTDVYFADGTFAPGHDGQGQALTQERCTVLWDLNRLEGEEDLKAELTSSAIESPADRSGVVKVVYTSCVAK